MAGAWECVSSYLRHQFRLQKLCFTHKDWKIITFSPWLPPAWVFQWIFLVYRWFLALYFSGWLLYYAIEVSDQGGRFMIYLSNWGYLIWVAYLISAAVTVTFNFIRALACTQVVYFPRRNPTPLTSERDSHTNSCCGCNRTNDNTNLCDKITWILYLIGGEGAVLIAILFWTTEDIDAGPISLHLHLLNAVVAIIDLWVSGVPVILLHFIYVQLFAVTYASFTGIYYTINSTDPIYPVLDYHSNPGLAVGLVVGMTVFGTVIVHLMFLLQYLCRRRATLRLINKYKIKYRLSFGASSAVHIITRQHSSSPPSSSASSSTSGDRPRDTTPILIDNKQQSHHSSHESFF